MTSVSGRPCSTDTLRDPIPSVTLNLDRNHRDRPTMVQTLDVVYRSLPGETFADAVAAKGPKHTIFLLHPGQSFNRIGLL